MLAVLAQLFIGTSLLALLNANIAVSRQNTGSSDVMRESMKQERCNDCAEPCVMRMGVHASKMSYILSRAAMNAARFTTMRRGYRAEPA